MNDLEALDRRVVGFQRLESADRLDQLLELAVIGFEEVVEIFDLPVDSVLRQPAFFLQVGDRRTIGRCLVNADLQWLFPVVQTVKGLAQEPLGRFDVPRRRQGEINRVTVLIDGPAEIDPLPFDLDVGLVDPPAARQPRPFQYQRSLFSISGAWRWTHR